MVQDADAPTIIDDDAPVLLDVSDAGRSFSAVVTLCDKVREVCPAFPGPPERIHWSIADPATAGATDEETYPAFRATAAELATRNRFLLNRLEAA